MNTQSQVSVLVALRTRMQGMDAAIGGVTKLVSVLAGMAGAYVGVREAIAGGRDIIKLGADMDHLAARSGVAVRDLLVLRQAFSDNGVAATEVDIALDRLTRRTKIATDGNNSYSKALKMIGLDAEELTKLDKFERFKVVADALSSTTDESAKTTAAMDLLDTAAGQLFPLFEDFNGSLADARRNLGRLPEVLQRNAVVFERIDTLLGRVGNKSRQFFAGVLDQIAPAIAEPLEAINTFDFTPMGQRLGAVIGVAMESFRNGETANLIALVIGGGFEKGAESAQKAWDGVMDYIMDPKRYARGFLEIAKDMTGFMSDAMLAMISSTIASTTYVVRNVVALLVNGFAGGINLVIEGAERALNELKGVANKLPGVNLEESDFSGAKVGGMDYTKFGDEFEKSTALLAGVYKAQHEKLEKDYQMTLKLLGLQKDENDLINGQLGYWDQLVAKLDEYQARRDALGTVDGTGLAPAGVGDGTETTPGEGDGDGGPGKGLDDAKTSAQLFEDALRTGVGGALGFLTGQTSTYAQLWNSIVNTITGPLISGMAQAGSKWIMTQIGMSQVSSALKKKDTAENAIKGGQDAAAKAPAALLSSISSWGLAVAVGVGAIAALGLFSDGGYTGPGGRWDPAGIVHRDEYVMDRYTTAAIGVDALDQMRATHQLPGYGASNVPSGRPVAPASARGGERRGEPTPLFFDSRRSAEEYAASVDFETQVVDIVKRRSGELVGA